MHVKWNGKVVSMIMHHGIMAQSGSGGKAMSGQFHALPTLPLRKGPSVIRG
jgi:hypothetical protein